MIKVITYGTYDLLHHGHINLLKRAKSLGDYLIVGVTSDTYDTFRGKISNFQSLSERIENIRKTGLADEIVVEEYEGQKIDDIKRMKVDVFAVGSDWKGKFDYLNEYCKVVYLPRTKGISSSKLRAKKFELKLGIIGSTPFRSKFIKEASYINEVKVVGIYSTDKNDTSNDKNISLEKKYDEFIKKVDAVYVISKPEDHYHDVKKALLNYKHVLCESPFSCTIEEYDELQSIAKENNLVLLEGIKTAYSVAYRRLVSIVKNGSIGDVVSVDSVCTSLRNNNKDESVSGAWNSICAWAPVAALPVFQILGTEYIEKRYYTIFADKRNNIDSFTKIDFVYPHGIGSIKVAKGAKSEGELVITGTKGYIYVPAPWWKTDYFEIRYENQELNKRFFYQLDGEGIRNEIVIFSRSIKSKNKIDYISKDTSKRIVEVVEDFNNKNNLFELKISR